MISFWPFRKTEPEPEPKKRVIDFKDLIPLLVDGRALPYDGDEEAISISPCPTEHRSVKVCACIDCPKRDMCVIEADFRAGDCRLRFARVCSVKTKGKPTGYEKIIVDNIVLAAVKKIAENDANWVYKKSKEKEKPNEGKESESTGV